ncbi:MAG: cation diffusion facilitator family transporter [Bacteroidales bacterium]|jgi:cobalt-zinc-cadmium efflux system protein|nr:cation diffusion facilitator family transporter [Bacteroidales bacterium]
MHNQANDHNHQAGKNIALAFFLNLSFTILELIGGLWTNSIAIMSDALHDFGDSVSLGMAWYFEKLSKQSPNAKYSYGYKRFALLGALLNCIILLLGSSVVIYECVKRLFSPQEMRVEGMLVLAILGVVINGFAVLRTRKGKGVNERVVSLHLLEDVLGWLAVLIVSIVMMFVDVPVLDPILSIGIAVFILYNVVRNLKTTLNVLLQGVPKEIDFCRIKEKIESIPQISSIHDLHIWSLDSMYNVASMHAVVENENITLSELQTVKEQIKNLMKAEDIEHATIEFENKNEHCIPCDEKNSGD